MRGGIYMAILVWELYWVITLEQAPIMSLMTHQF